MPDDMCDIVVVGAGAAGLAAAIFAAEAARAVGRNTTIVILDGATRIGAKILVSGGGRCNVTHERVRPEDFNGPRPVVRNILAAFNQQATVRWFAAMGVELKREPTGKLFPVSDTARTVLDALLDRCAVLAVALRCDHRVRDVRPDGRGFVVDHDHGRLRAHRVILATGGRSLPRTGSDGGGWRIAQALGHTVTPTHPALVPLVLDAGFFHAKLSGLSLDVTLSTFEGGGRRIDQRTGSLLWTHFGISGPVVMDASRHWVIAQAQGRRPVMRCALLPGMDLGQVESRWIIAASSQPRRPLGSLLADRLPQRLVTVLLSHMGIDASLPVGQLQREVRRRLAHLLTGLELPVVRDRGWNYAEVTAGGVPLREVDHRTMGSRCVPGLHLAGEMLDCDGRIGGFNFQWAWATGHLAGRAAAAGLP